MAQKNLYELTLDLNANSAQLAKGIKEANAKMDGFEKNVSKKLADVQKAFLVATGAIAGVAGILKTLKSSMESVEGPGDRLEASISGGKEALFEMQRAIGTMDFKNLINNLTEGYTRGKAFAEAMDELADKTAYSDYKVVNMELEVEQLKEVMKNKELELSLRQDAADKVQKLEERIKLRREELIQDSYDIEKTSWEGRNKMTVDEGIKLFENMISLEKTGYKEVTTESIAQIKNLYDETVKAHQLGGSSITRATSDAAKLVKSNLAGYGNYDFIKNVPKEDLDYIVNTLQQFSLTNETGEADVWKKLFEVINNKTTQLANTQRDYNKALKETTTLLIKEDEIVKSTAGKTDTPIARVAGISPVSTSNLSMPTLAASMDKMKLAEPAKVFKESWVDALTTVNSEIASLNDAFATLGNAISQASEDGKVNFSESMSVISAAAMSTIPIIQALAAAGMIQSEVMTKGLIGIATATAGLALLFGLFATYAKPKKMAEGGLVYGSSFVNVGEYANAGNDPEVISPLSKLQGMLGNSGMKGELTTRVSGSDILFVLKNAQRTNLSFS